jgi:plasmid maintenance system antidote protein VapI
MPMKNPPHPGDFIRTEILENFQHMNTNLRA